MARDADFFSVLVRSLIQLGMSFVQVRDGNSFSFFCI